MSLPLYEIIDWSETFENNRSRAIKDLRWCSMPNSFDGSRISELTERGGAAAYGAWCAFVLLCSRSPVRGRALKSSGQPHTLKSIARMTGLAAEDFATMLEHAADPEIALVKEVTQPPHPSVTPAAPQRHAEDTTQSPTCPPPDAEVTIEGKGIERKGREGEKEERAPQAPPSPSALNFHPSTDDSYWAALPAKFNQPAFTHAWVDWLAALDSAGHGTPSATGLGYHWGHLGAYPLPQAILAIQQATLKPWQNFFPEKITPAQLGAAQITPAKTKNQPIPEPPAEFWHPYLFEHYGHSAGPDLQWSDLPPAAQTYITAAYEKSVVPNQHHPKILAVSTAPTQSPPSKFTTHSSLLTIRPPCSPKQPPQTAPFTSASRPAARQPPEPSRSSST